MKNYNLKALGGGVGLRNEYFEEILKNKPALRWFEIISENFMGFGGYLREVFQEIRQNYTIIPHGVCLSIGSTDPLDFEYLQKLRAFLDEISAPWTSDHLCFTMVDHTNLNELIPLPFTKESANNVIERLRIVQNELGRPFLLENVTRYLTVSDREMSESEFISEVLEQSNCGLLLDLTNVILNGRYHGYDAWEFVKSLPLERVGQIHLSGFDEEDGEVIDSHDATVPEVVWELLKKTIAITGPTSVLIERDANLPSLAELIAESERANREMWAGAMQTLGVPA